MGLSSSASSVSGKDFRNNGSRASSNSERERDSEASLVFRTAVWDVIVVGSICGPFGGWRVLLSVTLSQTCPAN